ncbi:Mpo1 family 2-hydroxy fatty acid dioxygenase [Bdellovibrio sp. GT3]|uniref:Mpo1 family 2-hydroxy fatty acid dioxygenase n=1 Tax=Bdellovibrio sp. GT3 TaxID=3136282 RepID=UPI0030F10A29
MTLQEWFAEYGESHQNSKNKIIHKICVPLIFFSVVGLLLQIPVQMGPIKLGEIFIAIALGWYSTLGMKPVMVMLGQLVLCYILLYLLGMVIQPLWAALVIVFVLAWIGQFYGHKIEGKKPSFLKDLQFLLIGPLWVVKDLFFK